MPNHTMNTLSLDSDEHFDEIKEYLKGKDDNANTSVDFNKMIPQPADLEGTRCPCEPDAVLLEKYGASNWYDWRLLNWGTKWNAYNIDDYQWNKDDLTIHFDTAWSPLRDDMLEILSSKFPTVIFSYSYSCEGEGESVEQEFKNRRRVSIRTITIDDDDEEDDFVKVDIQHPDIFKPN